MMKFHPLADIFPLIEDQEFDDLVADIKKNGLREKMDLYQGKILDGRNRYRALRELGIDPSADPKKYFRKAIYAHTIGGEIAAHEQDNDARVTAYVISKNIHRRHLTAEQKRELIAKLIKATPEKSDRQIAATAKASPTTVGTVRAEMENKGEVSNLDTRTGANGVKQPSRKPLGTRRSKKFKRGKRHLVLDHDAWKSEAMPTKAEADAAEQVDLYDMGVRVLEQMTDETRRKLFAYIKEEYGVDLLTEANAWHAAPDTMQ